MSIKKVNGWKTFGFIFLQPLIFWAKAGAYAGGLFSFASPIIVWRNDDPFTLGYILGAALIIFLLMFGIIFFIFGPLNIITNFLVARYLLKRKTPQLGFDDVADFSDKKLDSFNEEIEEFREAHWWIP